jgi:iron(III) transport system permease protein
VTLVRPPATVVQTVREHRRRVRRSRPNLLAPITVLLLAYLVMAPVLMAGLSSFKFTDGFLPFEDGVPWTLQNYKTVFASKDTYSVMGNTLVFAIGATGIALVISIGLAWLVERTDLPGRRVIFVLVIAAIGVPTIITGISWVLLLNPTNGLVNLAFDKVMPGNGSPFDVFTMPGLIFVQSLTLVPVTFLLITAAFKTMDAAVEEAGLASGASRWTVMRKITLPMLAPALLGAVIYQFVNVVASFDLPLIIGLRGHIPLLSTLIFSKASPNAGIPDYGLTSAYSMFLLLMAFIPILLYTRLLARAERFATISGKGYHPHRVALSRRAKVGSLLLVAIYMLLSLGLPLFIMLWTSFQSYYAVPSSDSLHSMTFDAYHRIFTNPSISRVWVNTFVMGFGTALLAMAVGLLTAWVLVRTRSRFRIVLELLAFLPQALPGVIIGVSVLLLYLLLPLHIYGTIFIIIVGLTTQFVALSTRIMTSGIVQIDRQLEEAGEASGATRVTVLQRIILPLVRPAFLNGFLLIFLSSIQHLTVPLLLYTPDTVVLSTVIWNQWDHGDTGTTAAFGVVLMCVTITMSLVLRRRDAVAE